VCVCVSACLKGGGGGGNPSRSNSLNLLQMNEKSFSLLLLIRKTLTHQSPVARRSYAKLWCTSRDFSIPFNRIVRTGFPFFPLVDSVLHREICT